MRAFAATIRTARSLPSKLCRTLRRGRQVVIDVKAASVNFPDVLIIQNKYQFKPPLPFTPGARSPASCARPARASRSRRPACAWSPSPRKARSPSRRSRRRGMRARCPMTSISRRRRVPLAYGTSYHALVDRGALKAGETLLVLGAAGGVGLAAVEIGKPLGARVIAAASSAEKLALCREHGADATIDYATKTCASASKRSPTATGPDVIFDPVGGGMPSPRFAASAGADAIWSSASQRRDSEAAAQSGAAEGREHRRRVLGRLHEARARAAARRAFEHDGRLDRRGKLQALCPTALSARRNGRKRSTTWRTPRDRQDRDRAVICARLPGSSPAASESANKNGARSLHRTPLFSSRLPRLELLGLAGLRLPLHQPPLDRRRPCASSTSANAVSTRMPANTVLMSNVPSACRIR